MSLSPRQKRHLRGLAHALDPVLLVGRQGASDAVLAELEAALEAHELVKIRVTAEARAEREARILRLARASGAELVQRVGHVAVLYRRHRSHPRIVLPEE
ncbi:MAG: ribosome assembly RNA-binding protein YhbY [Xanthomonadales bacterium]|nr:ribosome assembly RNA-binding protein YhbY [Xanthomonadales bacterium]